MRIRMTVLVALLVSACASDQASVKVRINAEDLSEAASSIAFLGVVLGGRASQGLSTEISERLGGCPALLAGDRSSYPPPVAEAAREVTYEGMSLEPLETLLEASGGKAVMVWRVFAWVGETRLPRKCGGLFGKPCPPGADDPYSGWRWSLEPGQKEGTVKTRVEGWEVKIRVFGPGWGNKPLLMVSVLRRGNDLGETLKAAERKLRESLPGLTCVPWAAGQRPEPATPQP